MTYKIYSLPHRKYFVVIKKNNLVILLNELITVYFEVKVESLTTPWKSTGKVNGD